MNRLEKLTAFRTKIRNKLVEFNTLRDMVQDSELSRDCYLRLSRITSELIELLTYIDKLINMESNP